MLVKQEVRERGGRDIGGEGGRGRTGVYVSWKKGVGEVRKRQRGKTRDKREVKHVKYASQDVQGERGQASYETWGSG